MRNLRLLAGLVPLLAFLPLPHAYAAEALTAPEGFVARDMPYDSGGHVLLSWDAMPYDGKDVSYELYVSNKGPEGPWKPAKTVASDTNYLSDFRMPFWAWKKSQEVHALGIRLTEIFNADSAADKKAIWETTYHFKVRAKRGALHKDSEVRAARAKGNWFNLPRLNNLLFTFVFCGIVLWFISHARRKDLFLRRIPGLDAVEDAIGRATEMGRPIYFLTGRMDMDNISTIAASLILGEIAKKVAQYDTQLRVPHTYALTYAVCQEVTKQAYSEAGRPDAFREDINFFITEDQFAYTANVNGMMVREKPSACFYMGYYYAESLLLTEVGNSVGAIQIAGTDAEHQLPFFFITCDYTLIGEELYAAGAYLSRNPVLVGTLRGQDVGKAFAMIVVFAGALIAGIAAFSGHHDFATRIIEPFVSF